MPLNLPSHEISIFLIPLNGTRCLKRWVHLIRTGRDSGQPAECNHDWVVDQAVFRESIFIRRDPVDRFVAGYRHLTAHHGVDLSIGDFIEAFPELFREDELVHRHLRPQCSYHSHLGIESFDHVFDFQRLEDLKALLEERTGLRLPDPPINGYTSPPPALTTDQEDRIRAFYAVDEARGFEEGATAPAGSEKNRLHIILTTMRSGSTLFGNLLAEAGWIYFAGETGAELHDEEGVHVAITRTLSLGGGSAPGAPPCDKVLHPRLIRDGGRHLTRRGTPIYLLLRHPLGIWWSGKRTGWKFFTMKYLLDQFRLIRRILERADLADVHVVSYYELTSAEGRRRFFGRTMDRYRMIRQSGEDGWGDPGKLIRSGQVQERTIESELEEAIRSVWMDVEHPDLLRTFREYLDVLRLVGREDLDVPIPDIDADGLLIVPDPDSHEIRDTPHRRLHLTIDQIRAVDSLPLNDGVLHWIRSEDLTHRIEPRKLLALLMEFRRILKPRGVLRLSTVNMPFIDQVAEGHKRDIAAWHGEDHRDGTDCAATAANHLVSSAGDGFLYTPEFLDALLRRAGFRLIRRAPPDQRESTDLLSEGSYAEERIIVEARPA